MIRFRLVCFSSLSDFPSSVSLAFPLWLFVWGGSSATGERTRWLEDSLHPLTTRSYRRIQLSCVFMLTTSTQFTPLFLP